MKTVFHCIIAILVSVFSISVQIQAQPRVKIVLVEPDIRDKNVFIGEIPEIKFIAQAAPPGIQLEWSHSGIGNFDGNTKGLASIYLVPDSIPGKSEQVTIIVTITDSTGKTVQDSVGFTLLAPVPTDSLSSIAQKLKTADEYFKRRQYTTPQNENAFELYQDILREDPTNTHAIGKIRQMTAIYKKWGDNAYQQKKYSKAKSYYQRYLLVARYMLHTLGDETIKQDIQEVETRKDQIPTPSL